MAKVLIFALILVLLVFETTRAEDKKEDNFENMFVKRCDEKLPKDKSGEYDKCDSEASDAIKETVKKCAKENCNKDGKFNKLDVCCYAVKPNAMFDCFEKSIAEFEAKDAKAKGITKEELQKKNSHNAAKIVECYEEVGDDD